MRGLGTLMLAGCLFGGMLAVSCVLGGCRERAAARTPVTVLAAASLSGVLEALRPSFERANPDLSLRFSFAGSNQLRVQLEHGGPGDLFLSADARQIDAAAAGGHLDLSTRRTFAYNRLAVLTPPGNRAGVGSLSDLARPGLRLLVADSAVPLGAATESLLARAGGRPELGPAFVSGVRANVASREENAGVLVAKLSLGEADAGIGYSSDASSGGSAGVGAVEIAPELGEETEYVGAVTARARHPEGARRCLDYLATAEGAELLARFGFTPHRRGVP